MCPLSYNFLHKNKLTFLRYYFVKLVISVLFYGFTAVKIRIKRRKKLFYGRKLTNFTAVKITKLVKICKMLVTSFHFKRG